MLGYFLERLSINFLIVSIDITSHETTKVNLLLLYFHKLIYCDFSGFISKRPLLKPSTQQQQPTSSNDNNGGAQKAMQKNNCNCCTQTAKVMSLILDETRKTNDLLEKLLSK